MYLCEFIALFVLFTEIYFTYYNLCKAHYTSLLVDYMNHCIHLYIITITSNVSTDSCLLTGFLSACSCYRTGDLNHREDRVSYKQDQQYIVCA